MCPKTAKAYEVIREASKDNIRQAALEMFARYGFEKTSIRAIAKHANVSQGLMYNYFSSKEELLVSIYERSMQDVFSSFSEADKASSAKEKLERLIKASFEMLQDRREFWTVFYSLRSQPGIQDIMPEDFLVWQGRIQQQLQSYLEDLGHPNAVAKSWLLFASIDGIAQHFMLEPDYPLNDVLRQLLNTYLKEEA